MEKKTLLVGEPLGLFIAQSKGAFEDVSGYSMALAGAEFNVAIGIKRLGHDVGFLTKLGCDPFGKRVIKMMNECGISTELVSFSDERTTGFMLKSMVDHGDPEIYYYRKNSAASTLCPEDIDNLDFSEYDTIHMTGIVPALSDSTREAIDVLLEKVDKYNIQFSFDPNLRPQLWGDKNKMVSHINYIAEKCDIFLPGIKEAAILTGEPEPEKAAEFYLNIGVKTVIIKLGSKGAYYATDSECAYMPAWPEDKIIDTVGAGDGFAAGVLTALKEGMSLKNAVDRGNAIGTIQVMSRGDNEGLPTIKELHNFMCGNPNWRAAL